MFYQITNSKASPSKALHYCNDKAIVNDTFNMLCDGKDSTEEKIKEFELLASNNDNMEYNNRKYYHIKISPQEKDIDFNKLLDYGKEFLQEKYNNCQATLSIHTDNGRHHLHIIMNAVQLDFYKIQDNEKERIDKQVYATDTLAKKYNMQPTTLQEYFTPSNEKRKLIDFALDKENKKSDREQLKDFIYNAMKNTNTIEDFKEQLKSNGITVNEKKRHGQLDFKYVYNDRHYTCHSLGENYGRNYFLQVIEKKKEQQQAPTPQPQPSNDIDNLIKQYANDYDIEKEKKKKLKELEKELLTQLKENKLDTEKNLTLLKDTIESKELKLDAKIEKVNNFISQVAKIIKDIATEQVKQQSKNNEYHRGY